MSVKQRLIYMERFMLQGNTLRSNSLNVLILFVTFNYYLIHHFAPATFDPSAFSSDSGWGSIWTLLFILTAQAGTFWLLINSTEKRIFFDRLALLYIFQIYCFREADMHTSFTSPRGWGSVANGDFFVESDAPMMLKVAMGIVFVVFIACVFHLFKRYFDTLYKQFFKGVPHAVAFGFWGMYLVGSQICDRTSLNKSTLPLVKNIEEMCELTAAVFACAAVFQYMRIEKQEPRTPELKTKSKSSPGVKVKSRTPELKSKSKSRSKSKAFKGKVAEGKMGGG